MTNEEPKPEVIKPGDVRFPKCPYCKATMRPIAFKGYYDEFDCWECDCRDIPGAFEERGGYA